MRLALVGPMSDMCNLNLPAFDNTRDRLVELGHVIDSPADRDRQYRWVFEEDGRISVTDEFDYETAMTYAFEAIEKADGIVLLDGFSQSPGAMREMAHALHRGKQIFYIYDWADDQPLRRIS